MSDEQWPANLLAPGPGLPANTDPFFSHSDTKQLIKVSTRLVLIMPDQVHENSHSQGMYTEDREIQDLYSYSLNLDLDLDLDFGLGLGLWQ